MDSLQTVSARIPIWTEIMACFVFIRNLQNSYTNTLPWDERGTDWDFLSLDLEKLGKFESWDYGEMNNTKIKLSLPDVPIRGDIQLVGSPCVWGLSWTSPWLEAVMWRSKTWHHTLEYIHTGHLGSDSGICLASNSLTNPHAMSTFPDGAWSSKGMVGLPLFKWSNKYES